MNDARKGGIPLHIQCGKKKNEKKKEVQAVNRPASEQREREGKKQRITAR
jgi:hypothetical protein